MHQRDGMGVIVLSIGFRVLGFRVSTWYAVKSMVNGWGALDMRGRLLIGTLKGTRRLTT